jgi:hypothetical protein
VSISVPCKQRHRMTIYYKSQSIDGCLKYFFRIFFYVKQNAIKLQNISNLITSPSSYQIQCRKSRLVHFVIHGRHTSMECIPKGKFSKQMKKKLSYRIIRIKRIFSEVYWCITWTKSLINLHCICLWVNWSRLYINKLRKKCV